MIRILYFGNKKKLSKCFFNGPDKIECCAFKSTSKTKLNIGIIRAIDKSSRIETQNKKIQIT